MKLSAIIEASLASREGRELLLGEVSGIKGKDGTEKQPIERI